MKRRWDVFAEEALVIFSVMAHSPTALGESPEALHTGKTDPIPARPVSQDPATGIIVGTVEKLVGDFSARRDALPAGKAQPVAGRIYVFRGKIPSSFTPKRRDPRLVQVARSDEKGNFHIELPPGTYTLFAEIDGQLYRDEIDGRGNWAFVSVASGAVVRSNVIDRRNATF